MFKLREYQEEAVSETVSLVEDGSENIVVDSPPASGKSIMISETAKRLRGNVVISITITALLDQIAEHLDIVGVDYSILKSGRASKFDESKRIQLVQAQTMHARIGKVSLKCDYFIMDEVHREYETKRTMDILKELSPRARIGYSGTCYDQLGFALQGAEMIRTQTAKNLEDKGFLCPIKHYIPLWSQKCDFSSLKKSGNDYSTTDLDEIINTDNHLKLAIKSMNDISAKSKKTLVFCSGIEQADKFTKMLKKDGFNAEVFHSKSDYQDQIMDAFKNDSLFVKSSSKDKSLFDKQEQASGVNVNCLVSINKLGIGFDCPNVRLGVQLRPTAVRGLYIQQLMRLARIHSSKEFSEYLDLGQTTSKFGYATDIYNPPSKTGIKEKDTKALEEANTMDMQDMQAILTDKLEPITAEIYNSRVEEVKKNLRKELKDLSVSELSAAFSVSRDHKQIIQIATLIYTFKFGRPVSKAGRAYDYRPESFWSENTFGSNTHFHVHHPMEYYFTQEPEMKTKWIKSLKTRLRTIIKEGKPLFQIGGFIQFLFQKHQEQKHSFVEDYRKDKPELPDIDDAIDTDISDYDVDPEEIPF